MFENRAFHVRMVRTAPQTPVDPNAEPRTRMTTEQVIQLARENVKYVAILVGAGYALKKVLDTSSEATLIVIRSNFK